jgi:hypothetical protein
MFEKPLYQSMLRQAATKDAEIREFPLSFVELNELRNGSLDLVLHVLDVMALAYLGLLPEAKGNDAEVAKLLELFGSMRFLTGIVRQLRTDQPRKPAAALC